MNSNFEGFEKHPDGSIKIFPVSGFQIFTPHGMNCGLRVRYFQDAVRQQRKEEDALPLIMTVVQAKALAQGLLQAVARIEAPASEGKLQ